MWIIALLILSVPQPALADWAWTPVLTYDRGLDFHCLVTNQTDEPRTVWVEIVEATNPGTVSPDIICRLGPRESCTHTTSDQRAARCRAQWAGPATDVTVMGYASGASNDLHKTQARIEAIRANRPNPQVFDDRPNPARFDDRPNRRP